MTDKQTRTKQPCVYCHKLRFVTQDEVPGRGFFHDLKRKSRTYNGYPIRWVPSCKKCNHRFGIYNRHFRDLIAMAGNDYSDEAKKFMQPPHGKTVSFIRNHANVLQSLRSRLKQEWQTSSEGIIIGVRRGLDLTERDMLVIRGKLTKYALATYYLEFGIPTPAERSFERTSIEIKTIKELQSQGLVKIEHPDIYSYSAQIMSDGALFHFIFFNSVGFKIRMWNRLEGYKKNK